MPVNTSLYDGKTFGDAPLKVEREPKLATVPENLDFKVDYIHPRGRQHENLILTGIGTTIDIELQAVASNGMSTKVESRSVDRFTALPTPMITMGRFSFQVLKIGDKEISLKIIGDNFGYRQ